MRGEKMKTIDNIGRLCRKYPLFSPERNFVDEVVFWIKKAEMSLIPHSSLRLAESYIDVYEIKIGKKDQIPIIGALREVIKDTYKKFDLKQIK